MDDLRTVGPWAHIPLNDRLQRYAVVDMHPAQGTGKRQVATHVRSLGEAKLLSAAPKLLQLLKAARDEFMLEPYPPSWIEEADAVIAEATDN